MLLLATRPTLQNLNPTNPKPYIVNLTISTIPPRSGGICALLLRSTNTEGPKKIPSHFSSTSSKGIHGKQAGAIQLSTTPAIYRTFTYFRFIESMQDLLLTLNICSPPPYPHPSQNHLLSKVHHRLQFELVFHMRIRSICKEQQTGPSTWCTAWLDRPLTDIHHPVFGAGSRAA